MLELADYSKGQRARILYNHLYFSDLPRDYKEEMLRDEFFLEVVAHKHFSPRLIEWLSSAPRLRNVTSADYREHVRSILANPQAIWSHAFNQQISVAARSLLLVLYSMGESCELSEIEPLWNSFDSQTASKYRRPVDPRGCRNALKELDNAFVSYKRGRIEFLNPSVREMVAGEIVDLPEHAVDLVAAAGRFRQIVTLFELGNQNGREPVRDILSTNANTLIRSITSLLRTPHLRWHDVGDGRRVGTYMDLAFERRMEYIAEIASTFSLAPLRVLFESEIRSLATRYRKGSFEMSSATSLVKAFDTHSSMTVRSGASLQRELLDAVLSSDDGWWAEQLNTLIECSKVLSIWSLADDVRLNDGIAHYRTKGLEYEYDSCSETDDYERLRDEPVSLGEKLGVEFAKTSNVSTKDSQTFSLPMTTNAVAAVLGEAPKMACPALATPTTPFAKCLGRFSTRAR